MPRMNQRLRVLLLSSNEEATALFRESLANEVNLATAWNSQELFRLLETGQFDAFLCDWESQGGRWQEVCREAKQTHPDLPIIVLCRLCQCGGEREWVEVLEAGYFDLVCSPYLGRQILSVIEHAVASREARVLMKSVA